MPTFKYTGFFIAATLFSANQSFAGIYDESNIGEYLAPLEQAHVTTSAKKGLEIYTRQYLIDEGWGSMVTTMEMELTDAAGVTSTRTVKKETMEEAGEPDKTLGIFVSPKDIKGTVMLTYEHSVGADSQWLYMPSIKRTKKINAKNKSGSFVGSEFSWEDISTTELTKYTYNLISENEQFWIVERVPVYEFSGYSKQMTHVNKKNYQTEKIEFFDKKGDLLKTLTMTDWRLYKDRYWRAKHYEMKNIQNHKLTILRLSEYQLGLAERSDFNSMNLNKSD
jgi:Outer membrane lipoprotein-sorting protein